MASRSRMAQRKRVRRAKSSDDDTWSSNNTESDDEQQERKPRARPNAGRQLNTPQVAPGDKAPRQRYSKTWEERKKMEATHDAIVNPIPPLEPTVFATWEEFDAAFEAYQEQNCARYSTRSSRGIGAYNRAHPDDPIPSHFDRIERDYVCVNGRSQESRGEGYREHRVNYNGCLARVYMKVKRVAVNGRNCWRVVVHSQTFTHSHPTSKETYDSHFGTRNIDTEKDGAMLDQAARMINTGSTFKHVKEFLAFELGKNISAQTARNIIKLVEGKTSPVERVKLVLDEFAEAEGNHVILVQDQMDITTVVAMQSRIQKKCFSDWGDCLVMDWTHNTNNLGYHLGSLIVTCPSGRGIPVIDFIALNEQADSMRYIFEFFKKHNPTWKNIRTFIIDKDFTEWQVLEECFPNASVLLCQYHAMTFWRKLVRKQKYNLRLSQRDDIEALFIKMMYSKHLSAYNDAYNEFLEYCLRICPPLLDYYIRNWKACSHMWADYARSNFFTAGNTTTNRIEAHWNQLKKIIGMKPKVHLTIAGLLSHQVALLNQFSTTVRQHILRSRQPASVPEFLHRSASLLSDYALKKLVRQFNIMISAMDGTTITQIDDIDWNWQVQSRSRTYKCDDLAWTCTCSFSVTTGLPCRHLQKLAKDVLKFEQLPTSSIPRRWNMHRCREYLDEVESSARVLIPLIASVKAPGATLTKSAVTLAVDTEILPDASDLLNLNAPSKSPAKRKGVYHVRLRREERHGLVVLARAEKYNLAKAVVEPLLDHLASLSSADFYVQLDSWRKLVANGLAQTQKQGSDSEDRSDRDSSDVDDALDVNDFMKCEARYSDVEDDGYNSDTNSDLGDDRDQFFRMDDVLDNPSQVSLPDLVVSTQSQRVIFDEADDPRHSSKSSTTSSNENSGNSLCTIADHRNLPLQGNDMAQSLDKDFERGIEVLSMPAPKKPDKTRQKRGGKRTAVIDTRNASALSVPDIVAWAGRVPNLEYVCNVLKRYPVFYESLDQRTPTCKWELADPIVYSYNFVLSRDMVMKMHSAIRVAMGKRRMSATSRRASESAALDVDQVSSQQQEDLLVTLTPAIGAFSRQFVNHMHDFYSIKGSAMQWSADIKWLGRDWTRASAENVHIFSRDVSGRTLGELASACTEKATAATLSTTYRAKSGANAIHLRDVVGSLARSTMLTDATMNMGCRLIVDTQCKDSMMLNSFFFNGAIPTKPPRKRNSQKTVFPILSMKYVIIPVHLPAHWGVFVVDLHNPDKFFIHAYESKSDRVYQDEMRSICKKKLIPFLKNWFDCYEKQRVTQLLSTMGDDVEVVEVRTVNSDGICAAQDPHTERLFPPVEINWITQPHQEDGVSCGVFALGMAYSIVHSVPGTHEFVFANVNEVSPEYIQAMRLRIMWMLLCTTTEEHPVHDDLQQIQAGIVSEFPPDTSERHP